MARKRKLRPGIGARATILTRYIKPKQPLPDGNKKHRSEIILKERYLNNNNKVFYRFTYALDLEDKGPIMHATAHWVALTKEGHHHDLFDGPGEPLPETLFKEPKIKWRHSRARKLLYKDITSGEIDFDEDGKPLMDIKEIYAMHPEYAEYHYDRFEERLEDCRQLFESYISRAEDDCAALENYISNHKVSQFNHLGMIHWQGSEAQELALKDIADEVHLERGYRYMYDSRSEYFHYFDYSYFKQRIRQEVRTSKYHHTLLVRNMQGMKAT